MEKHVLSNADTSNMYYYMIKFNASQEETFHLFTAVSYIHLHSVLMMLKQ